MPTLYVSDLDGTLLNRAGELSEATRRGLHQVLERGVAFTVASARSLVSMQELLAGVPLTLPVAGLNGGTLSDVRRGVHLKVHTVPDVVARGISDLAKAHQLPVMIGAHAPEGERMWVPEVHTQGMAAYVADRQKRSDPRLRLVPDSAIGLNAPVTSLTVIARPDTTNLLAEQVRDRFAGQLDLHVFDDFYEAGWVWMTAHAREATKGHAIETLIADHVPDTDRVVVFGDQINDVSMFERADYGVATDNAVPQVRALAHEVIGHHDDDAVIHWLLAHAR